MLTPHMALLLVAIALFIAGVFQSPVQMRLLAGGLALATAAALVS